ncbi:MAG TPA: hypothetical protein DCG19_13745 [Cryomorphaceae bacterium]|nr:hypothetical protein [Owenweeksia sp.]MBF99373.1 hypothetical protein [Owenweeksia sp.]HAD98467.1 hypothetical protein [Cryomorphaceae bacterium]HBF19447.1 hypothetical protein [Cryomorphaceae bacterium]HCQ14824.1 hypothetical protein [Cryomorphaceae bacterium]|tara:strand:+ start:681 stop:1097 length:417 start_codon:yes stop_codon:yes gene_type:complete
MSTEASGSASISGSIKTDISVNGETYDLSVDIPTSTPVQASPYELMIYSKTEQAKTPTGENVPTLLWMEAYYDAATDSGAPQNMYLQLSPPASILPSGTSFAINNLSVSFATGAFTTTPPTDGPKGTKAATPPNPPQQ